MCFLNKIVHCHYFLCDVWIQCRKVQKINKNKSIVDVKCETAPVGNKYGFSATPRGICFIDGRFGRRVGEIYFTDHAAYHPGRAGDVADRAGTFPPAFVEGSPQRGHYGRLPLAVSTSSSSTTHSFQNKLVDFTYRHFSRVVFVATQHNNIYYDFEQFLFYLLMFLLWNVLWRIFCYCFKFAQFFRMSIFSSYRGWTNPRFLANLHEICFELP